MAAQHLLRCTKLLPEANFVTFDASGTGGFLWVAFFFMGKFPGFWGCCRATQYDVCIESIHIICVGYMGQCGLELLKKSEKKHPTQEG